MATEKLCKRQVVCYVVYAYHPHRTRKGHYVWRRGRVVQEALSPEGFSASPYGKLQGSMYHNKPLTPDEIVQFVAEEGLEK